MKTLKEIIKYHDDKKTVRCSYFLDINDKKQGVYKCYYPNGKLEKEGPFKNDEKDSVWIMYYPTGKTQTIAHYKNGLLHGKVIWYYENGEKTISNYKNDVLSGKSVFYYANGNIKGIYHFKNNNRHGSWKEFYENENFITYGTYFQDFPLYFTGLVSLYLEEKQFDKFNVLENAILELLYAAGLRVSELVNLSIANLNLKANILMKLKLKQKNILLKNLMKKMI